MSDPTITCPKCSCEIKLTDSLAAPLVASARTEYEKKLALLEKEIAQREAKVIDQLKTVEEARRNIEEQVEEKLAASKAAIIKEEEKKARRRFEDDLAEKAREAAELNELLKKQKEKLDAAAKVQAEMVRKERELEEAKREIDLTIETRLKESSAAIRDKAKKDAEDEIGLKVEEKEHLIKQMQKQIEDLKRRAEQGSQQVQGEVQELKLEELLCERFPHDEIAPVPKGEFGGDALQTVKGFSGQPCGTILWESKRTKNWSDGWLAKLRDDQRAAKAELAVIVTQVLPKEIETFGQLDGIWITTPRTMIPVALVLRQSLIDIARVRQTTEGQQTKMELVYQYLTGPRFMQRVSAIVERFQEMEADLDKERKTMTRLWSKRKMQIDGVIAATAGMYGDLQGIAGRSLQEIEGLSLKELEAPSPVLDAMAILMDLNDELGMAWRDGDVPELPECGWKAAKGELELWAIQIGTTWKQWTPKARRLLDCWWNERRNVLE
jgi:hypothetical protein